MIRMNVLFFSLKLVPRIITILNQMNLISNEMKSCISRRLTINQLNGLLLDIETFSNSRFIVIGSLLIFKIFKNRINANDFSKQLSIITIRFILDEILGPLDSNLKVLIADILNDMSDYIINMMYMKELEIIKNKMNTIGRNRIDELISSLEDERSRFINNGEEYNYLRPLEELLNPHN